MSQKRILIIVQNLPVPFDRRVWQEALALTKAGYQVNVICPQGTGFEEPYEFLEGVHIYRHPLTFEARDVIGYLAEYAWSLSWQFYLAAKIYFARGFDAIQACNPPDNIFLVVILYKFFLGKKFIFDHHDLNPELFEAKFGKRGFFYQLLLLFERLTFRLADISIAPNNSYHKIAMTRGKMKPENVSIVRSGPSLERMKILPAVKALKHGRKYLIGYVGVMGKQEGIDTLLEAARIIVHDFKRTDVHFTLVGNGTEFSGMKTLAKQKNIADFVTFTGRVSDKELLEVLNTADICVNCDTVNDMNDKSTMNKVLEYMCLGKPIVQFEMTEGRVSAAEASLYAKPNDVGDFAAKIIFLLDAPEIRAKMGKLGRQRIEKELAWEHEAPKLISAYEKLFSKQSFDQQYRWYYYRLLAMSFPEIRFRVQEKLRRLQDARMSPRITLADYGALPNIPGLKEKISAWDIPEEYAVRIEKQLEGFYAGNLRMLGQDWPAFPLHEKRSHEKWHLDPVKGIFWPKNVFCFAIDFRHARQYGDVKYVWELNRLQYLQVFAILAFKRGNESMAKFCLDEIESWIDNNPPYLGINWASGIELALRAISILTVGSFVGEHATQAQREKIWGTLEAHALWIERYPSRFSSANNHKAAEALALFVIGTLCPALPGAARWKVDGWQSLCECVQTLVLPDGSGAEQAIAYTAFTLEILMFARMIAQAEQMSVPDYYNDRLRSAGECLGWFTDCKGNHPLIGDDDQGRVFGTFADEGHYVNSVRAALAAEFSTTDSPRGFKIFPDGGYTVVRSSFHGKETLLAMDHGKLGFGSLAAHGHADTLALWLHIDGQPVLVDAGTYLYHGDSKWREYFRDTGAHNTLMVEKTDSSIMAGNFNWSHKAQTQLIATHENGEDDWQVSAQHDGYVQRFGVIHRRTLSANSTQGFIVEDMLTGKKPHQVDINFLLHPSLVAKEVGESLEIYKGEKMILRIVQEGSLTRSIESGWYAPHFGEKKRTHRIVFSGIVTPEQKVITRFYY